MIAVADTINPRAHWRSTLFLFLELVALVLLGWFPWRIGPGPDGIDAPYLISWALVVISVAFVLIICARSLFTHSWRAGWAALWNVLLLLGAVGIWGIFAILYSFSWGPM